MAKILGTHIPLEVKNYIINGALDFWQAVNGNTTTVNTASNAVNYCADMVVAASFGSTVKNYSVVRSTDIPSAAQSGFQGIYSWLYTQITGIASPATTDQTNPFMYFMEGLDYEKIHGRTVTFGFWVKASIAGTYSFSIRNNAGDRSYVTTFAVNGTNTWEFKTITVTLDSSGTWAFDSNRGLTIAIGSIAGSNQSTGLLNTWQGGNFVASTSNTNWMGTSGATFQVTQFSLVEGTLGLAATGFQRHAKDIASEQIACERYYRVQPFAHSIWLDSTTTGRGGIFFEPMRVTPGITAVSPGFVRYGPGGALTPTVSFGDISNGAATVLITVASGFTVNAGGYTEYTAAIDARL